MAAGLLHMPSSSFATFGKDSPMDSNHALQQRHAATRAEWRSLLGTLEPFAAPRLRWSVAPGPKADSIPHSSRAASWWRQAAQRFKECANLLKSPTPTGNCMLETHVCRMYRQMPHVSGLLSEAHKFPRWLAAAAHAVHSAGAYQLRSLVKRARIKADKLVAAAKTHVVKEWNLWLRWATSSIPAKSCQATRCAFSYVRGPAE